VIPKYDQTTVLFFFLVTFSAIEGNQRKRNEDAIPEDKELVNNPVWI
jgi:hypothetical protein